MFDNWLKEFFNNNFNIYYSDNIKRNNFYLGDLNLTPAEVAFLLSEFCNYFEFPLTKFIDNMKDFTCLDMELSAEKLLGDNK